MNDIFGVCSNFSCVGAILEDDVTGQVGEKLTGRDASWILTSTVIIFTMQTGFGLLESGAVSPKNEVNIMVKNALDVVFGGISYWAFGFGFSFGHHGPSINPFIGIGCFFLDASHENMGYIFAVFLFQLSFATTSTTIVSGAMAERTKLSAYIMFSILNTIIYSIPTHWVWSEAGFLYRMGALDVAGAGPVHLVGGVTGLVATVMLKPRICFLEAAQEKQPLPSPHKAILGMFMLWWAWLRFNSGSVFVISTDSQWKHAVRAAVNTILASTGGGISSVVLSCLIGKLSGQSRYDVSIIINGVLGSLVSITGLCTLVRTWEAVLIGMIAAIWATGVEALVRKAKIDDPVGVIPVHVGCSIWGLLSVGLFLEPEDSIIKGQGGLFKTRQWYILGIQSLTILIMITWTALSTSILLKLIDVTVGLRVSKEDELVGADIKEHGVGSKPPHRRRDEEESKETEEDPSILAMKEMLNLFFVDVIKSCSRNGLHLTLEQNGRGGILMFLHDSKMSTISNNVMADSGIDIHTGHQDMAVSSDVNTHL